MKQWKKLTLVSAGALLTVGLAACSNHNDNDKSSSKTSMSKVAKSSSKKLSSSSVMLSSSSLSSSSSSNIVSSNTSTSSTQPTITNSAVAGFSDTNNNSKTNNTQQNQTTNTNINNQNNNVINTPQQAIQAAINKYGTDNGKWRWSCLVSGSFNNPQCKWLNGNPVSNNNPDGYFVVRNYLKNDPNSGDGGMINTYRVYPNGNIVQAGF